MEAAKSLGQKSGRWSIPQARSQSSRSPSLPLSDNHHSVVKGWGIVPKLQRWNMKMDEVYFPDRFDAWWCILRNPTQFFSHICSSLDLQDCSEDLCSLCFNSRWRKSRFSRQCPHVNSEINGIKHRIPALNFSFSGETSPKIKLQIFVNSRFYTGPKKHEIKAW